jgi:hypothetical protein
VVRRCGVLTMKMLSGDCMQQRWGPGARGRRGEGEGHYNMARRASMAVLAGRGEKMVAAAVILGEVVALQLARVDMR